MESASDGGDGVLMNRKYHVQSGQHSSFEQEVVNQLSRLVEIMSCHAKHSERIIAVDAKLDKLLHPSNSMDYNSNTSSGGTPRPINTAPKEHYSVAIDAAIYEHRAEEQLPSSDSNELEDVSRNGGESPTRLMMRRVSNASEDLQEGIARAVKSIDNILGLHRVNAWRLRIWALLDDPDSGCAARIFYVLMVCIIITSILLSLLQTVDETPIDVRILSMVDTIFDGVFFLEVLLRFMFCPSRWAFFRTGYNTIDLVSAMPLVIRGATGFTVPPTQDQYTAIDFVLIVFVPTLRLLKLLRHFNHLRLLRFAADIALEALVVPLFLLFILCLFFSSLIYVLEPRDNITSLPHAVWLVVVTLSTVGYGDTLPSKPGTYVLMSVLVASGVLYMAVPLSIVGQAWNSVWIRRDEILLMDLARDRLKTWGYTAADMNKLFDCFDLNNDQLLDIDEFSTMVTEMRIGLSGKRIAELFDTLDTDKNGFVDFCEFARALFPEHYIDAVRQRAHFQSSSDGASNSSKSNRSSGSPKGSRKLLRSLSGLSSNANQAFSRRKSMLRRSLSNLSSVASKSNNHGDTEIDKHRERTLANLSSFISEPKSPVGSDSMQFSSNSSRFTDEHPSCQGQFATPTLPREDRPTKVPKSMCQLGFISEGSSESQEGRQNSYSTCNGYRSEQATTTGCDESISTLITVDSSKGVRQL